MRVKTSRLYRSYKEQLSAGHVEITQAELNSLGNDINYSDYYLLLCEICPDVKPWWNVYLFNETLELDLLQWIRMPSYERRFMETYAILMKTPIDVQNSACTIVRFCICQLLNYYMNHDQDIRDRLEIILERIFMQDAWRTTLFSIEWEDFHRDINKLLKKHKEIGELFAEEIALETDFYELTVKPLIRTNLEIQRAYIQSRIAIYKEELIAAAWHPRRVQRWVDHYGLDTVFDHM